MKGLKITKEERAKLLLAVEETAVSHLAGFRDEIKKKEEEAQQHRLQIFDETFSYCEEMALETAKEIVFQECTKEELLEEFEEYEEENKVKTYHYPDPCPKCGGSVDTERHVGASIWCSTCGYIIKKEGWCSI